MKITKQRLLVWVGLVVTLGSLALVFRTVPLREFVEEWGRVRWAWLLPSALLLYGGMVIRAWRWHYLFGNDRDRVRNALLLKGVMVGYAFNNVLPSGRMGELARALYVSKKGNLPFSVVLGTIVNERVFDSVTVLLMVAAASLWILPIDPDLVVAFGGFELSARILNPLFIQVMVGSVGMVLAVSILLLPGVSTLVPAWIARLPGLSESLRARLVGFAEGVFRGLGVIKNARRFAVVSGYSVAIWGMNAASAYALAWAIPGLTMSPFQAFAVMAFVTVCAAIPALPGFWGLYEAGMIFGFQLLAIHSDQAVALVYGVTIHLIYYVPTTVLGLGFAFKSAIRLNSVTLDSKDQAPEAN